MFIHLHTHPSPRDKFLKWKEKINDYINTVSIPLLPPPPPPYILLTQLLHHPLVLSASQRRASVHLSGWFGCRCHSCRKTRQDFRRNRSTPPFRGILANLLQPPVLKTVAHSHIPCTWFELQRVKCCLRLARISKGASRAALFSRPIVFFVKSCCLLFGLHTGTYEMLEKFAHFKIWVVVSFSEVEFSELIWHTPASITCSLCL